MATLSVQLYSDVTSVNSVFVPDKIINNSDKFEIKCLSYSKISVILCVLYFLFLHFFNKSWKTCQIMWANFDFLVIFDTCDVVYNWPISLLPPIVLDNLFGSLYNYILKSRKTQIKSSKVLSEGFYNSWKIYLLTKLPFSGLILEVRVNARRD